jgi:hypothetical protein
MSTIRITLKKAILPKYREQRLLQLSFTWKTLVKVIWTVAMQVDVSDDLSSREKPNSAEHRALLNTIAEQEESKVEDTDAEKDAKR